MYIYKIYPFDFTNRTMYNKSIKCCLTAVAALLVGFLRKDVAVGMLVPLGLGLKQLVIASVVLAMYFPCAATFAVLVKELGVKDMIKSTVIMIFSAILVGSLLNLIL